MTAKKIEIAKGVFMPIIGVGTWEMRDPRILHDVLDSALKVGYRFIDTAFAYGNENFIAESLKSLLPKYGLKRADIFITSKVPPSHQGAKMSREAVLTSLKNLEMDYIDLYLIHFPGTKDVDNKDAPKLKQFRRETWLELEKFRAEGKLKAIGVSNYMVRHLKEMSEYATVPPAVNQCEFHPHLIRADVVDYCRQHDIHFQAYSSLGSAHSGKALLNEPLVGELSQKYKCDEAQLLLAWAINQNVSVLPKTTKPDHVINNFKAAFIEIDENDVEKLSSLHKKAVYSWDPSNVS